MADSLENSSEGTDEPKVYRIAQVDTPLASKLDRRKFVKLTAAGVGAVAATGLATACESQPEEDPAEERASKPEVEAPAAPVAPEPDSPVTPASDGPSDDESAAAAVICSCDSVCTCEAVCSCVGDCTCDSVTTPGGHYWYPT